MILLQNFDRHLNFNRDHNELLLYLLKQLVKDQLRYERARHKEALSAVAIPESDFIEKVCFCLYCFVCIFEYFSVNFPKS